LSIGKLAKVGVIYVVEIGFQIAEHRRERIEPVVSKGDRLGVAQFGERFHVEPVIPLLAVGLGRADVGLVGEGLAGEIADARILSAFRNVVIDAPFLVLTAKIARNFCGEVIRQREKDFGPEGLQQSTPGFAGQGCFQGADALGCQKRNALGLPRKGKEFLVATRLVFTDRGKVLVFVAYKKDGPPLLLGTAGDTRNSI